MRETSVRRLPCARRRNGWANTVHFGRIVELCHEKGSELEIGDPERKMKGRSVLLGDNVKDQDFSWFQSSHD